MQPPGCIISRLEKKTQPDGCGLQFLICNQHVFLKWRSLYHQTNVRIWLFKEEIQNDAQTNSHAGWICRPVCRGVDFSAKQTGQHKNLRRRGEDRGLE